MMVHDEEEVYDNPVLISQLWSEWVVVVCGWKKIPKPTHEEWQELYKRCQQSTPDQSVCELIRMRSRYFDGYVWHTIANS